MERITAKKLDNTIALINEAMGLNAKSVGALKLYKDHLGCRIARIVNNGGGVSDLTGIRTPKDCMAYLRQFASVNCLHLNL